MADTIIGSFIAVGAVILLLLLVGVLMEILSDSIAEKVYKKMKGNGGLA